MSASATQGGHDYQSRMIFYWSLIMAALCSRCGHYIFVLYFVLLLLSFSFLA